MPIRKTCLGTLFSIYIVFASDRTACFADCSLFFFPNSFKSILSRQLSTSVAVRLSWRHISCELGKLTAHRYQTAMTSEVWFEGWYKLRKLFRQKKGNSFSLTFFFLSLIFYFPVKFDNYCSFDKPKIRVEGWKI